MSSAEAQENALRCVKLAKDALARRQFDNANRLIAKSLRIFPTLEAKVLERKIEAAMPAPEPTKDPAATRILSERCYYKILGVDSKATASTIKKAYFKQARAFHPDKNSAGNAGEAFKSIQKAYDCLSAEESRALYDRVGPDGMDENGQNRQPGFGRNPFHGGGHGQMNPDDILRAFFQGTNGPAGGGGFQFHFGHPQRTHRHTGRQSQQRRQQHPSTLFGLFMQFMPLILIILASFFSMSSPSTSSAFNLQRSSQYYVKRETSSGLPYFVSPSFQRHYGTPYYIHEVEKQVLDDYLTDWSEKCQDEKQTQAENIAKAKRYRGADQYVHLKRAHELPSPNCDSFEAFLKRRT